ncbi:MAG: Spy/CpxP family protein refolding chaperone [Proteobacteria bacterium]|nr:Spy/CpxP family protein refolding chaperone [Pseudomonadota bacterium]
MNSFRKTMLVGALVIAFGGGAYAAQPTSDAPRGGDTQNTQRPRDEGKFHEHMAKRQAALHDKLKLTAAQEPAWQTFAASMTPPPRDARPDRNEWKNMSAPDRMEKMLAKMKERETKMGEHLAAMKTFYAQLTPEQQKVFNDNVGKGMGHHHKRDGDGGGHGGRGQRAHQDSSTQPGK